MVTPDDTDDAEETGESETPAPAPRRTKKPARKPEEAKNRGPGKAKTPAVWANKQAHPVSAQLKRIVDALKAKEAHLPEHEKVWTEGKIGKLAGYSDHSQVSRYLVPCSGDTHGFVRIANALGYELLVVPKNSELSVLARLHDANEGELAAIVAAVDLLLDFRSNPDLADQLRELIGEMRKRQIVLGYAATPEIEREAIERRQKGREGSGSGS